MITITQEGVQRAAKEAELYDAARQLAKSEKGRDAMQRVLDWLDASGIGLDERNQDAILELLTAAWGGYAGMARDVMRDTLGYWG